MKFSDFEDAAIQRENDYKQIIEQQRLDSEQMKSFEKLKESNMEMRSVKFAIHCIHWQFFISHFSTENSKATGKLSNLWQSNKDAYKAIFVFRKGKSVTNFCWTSTSTIRAKPKERPKTEELNRQ